MTREEVREAIKEACGYSEYTNEIINTLEQEPCDDCISIQAVLDKIKAEILDEAEYAYADFDEYKCDVLHAEPDELPDDDFRYGLRRAIEIINKRRRYK